MNPSNKMRIFKMWTPSLLWLAFAITSYTVGSIEEIPSTVTKIIVFPLIETFLYQTLLLFSFRKGKSILTINSIFEIFLLLFLLSGFNMVIPKHIPSESSLEIIFVGWFILFIAVIVFFSARKKL